MEVSYTFQRGDKFGEFAEIVAEESRVAAQQCVDVTVPAVRSFAPKDLGVFIDSIVGQVTEDANSVTGSVSSTDDPIKVAVIEGGRAPGTYPPVGIITLWANRHGIPPFLAGRAIFENGIAPVRPFGQAEESTAPQIQEIYAQFGERVAARM
jgi:hypothetical protein